MGASIELNHAKFVLVIYHKGDKLLAADSLHLIDALKLDIVLSAKDLSGAVVSHIKDIPIVAFATPILGTSKACDGVLVEDCKSRPCSFSKVSFLNDDLPLLASIYLQRLN